ncbi:hypothetical protein DV736_g1258, partial [Chaetothyriales sp. CBS 134916]
MHFADAYEMELINVHVGKTLVLGKWEGKDIDFRLLRLWEERRWKDLGRELEDSAQGRESQSLGWHRHLAESDLAPHTALIGHSLVLVDRPSPKPNGAFVITPTTQSNMNALGTALLDQYPILLRGPAGCGKTSLVLEAARILGKLDSLVTLHLNEQTDAKSLIGLYTSSTTDSGFVWHPGVVTKALSEGRWILIEDIERAPVEVLGVLRPLVQNQSLFIPNRKQTIRAKEGFRIFATTQTIGHTNGFSTHGKLESWISNERLWATVNCAPFNTGEYHLLISKLFPGFEPFIETILETHSRIEGLLTSNTSSQASQSRRPTLRDLLKWGRRIHNRLQVHGIHTSLHTLPDSFQVDMFKDALDCYASHLADELLYHKIAESVAFGLNISPQQIEHHLQTSLHGLRDQRDSVTFGRTCLPKLTSRSPIHSGMPFANTTVAMHTLESLAAGVASLEPQLLVGETGIGKTSIVQHLANTVGQKLVVVNLSQQSEASDLLGGLKPMTVRSLVLPVAERFNELFDTTFPSGNEKFKVALAKALSKQSWTRLLRLWQEAIQSVQQYLSKSMEARNGKSVEPATKKRKLSAAQYTTLQERWSVLSSSIDQVRRRVENQSGTQIFTFVEGRLVEAVRSGSWLLLDEINLATSDSLDQIGSLLRQGTQSSPFLLLSEADNIEMIEAHPNFRVFAAMNPATDTGKKDLVPNIRSRFTELYVHAGDTEIRDLVKIIQAYLGNILANDNKAAVHLAKAYLKVQEVNKGRQLTDGAGELPHFSLRSLVRCLLYVRQHHVSHGLRRSMYEGFAMSFFTVLSRSSESIVAPVVTNELLAGVNNPTSLLARQPKLPTDGKEFIAFKHHLVPKGPMAPDFQPHYIRTPSVDRNLLNLARAATTCRFPVLLQGPTSAGKTSMVEYLAKLSGHKFVRINNHEHTDLQEYLGNYTSGPDGSLQFREGVLVDALRQGHWLVLDELNLASSDVLEALNRLLDDNRELLIPETQEIVRPHPNFMLFATQNPAGLYGGRKHLSRAFRNRFLEIHFDDIPEDELEIILTQRSRIAPSFCKQIVAVYKKLSLQRQSARLFEQRNSFATLRDLFRWASRKIDDRQQLAINGFLLLGERVRDPGERLIVKEIIEETIRVKIDENELYSLARIPEQAKSFPGIIWTPAMRRLFFLVSEAVRNEEPVLLVGETGCGKTQICQVIAHAFGRPLNIYNAHTNTETGDLIGSQRPVRSRERLARDLFDSLQAADGSFMGVSSTSTDSMEDLIARFQAMDPSTLNPDAVARVHTGISAYRSIFLWNDGSLVRAMKSGEHFLLDEISLADDSVLERLNSVLEPSRTVLLAEKGSLENVVTAKSDFQFLATMNPGGDYGKRELSAALRNRMTEIWVPPLAQSDDILPLVKAKLGDKLDHFAQPMLGFAKWFAINFRNNPSTNIVHLRDLLGWCNFIHSNLTLEAELAFVHGAGLVYIDSLGASPAALAASLVADIERSRLKCVEQLQTYVSIPVQEIYMDIPKLVLTDESVILGPFTQTRVSTVSRPSQDLVFDARTTRKNMLRVMRALQMSRPILLEGSPGVGKTAIVTTLASLVGKPLSRINLSDQTDIADLFGADAPLDNESLGSFSWQDGPLLKAMQEGSWVLLDEMNLASQSVLEGLNSCIDHRKQIYVAELDRTFDCHPDFRLFAAQNPHHQGGGRKGLPLSFVNRFTVVYADAFTQDDILSICRVQHPTIDPEAMLSIVDIASQAHAVLGKDSAYANGGPWEVNIRDITRWFELCQAYPKVNPLYHCGTVILNRFRDSRQRARLWELIQTTSPYLPPESLYPRLSPQFFQVGLSFLTRKKIMQPTPSMDGIPVNLLSHAKAVITAFSQSWPVILAGGSRSGKTQLIHSLAAAAGANLVEISMNSDIDTIDLLGGFEQYDEEREIQKLKDEIMPLLQNRLGFQLLQTDGDNITQIIALYKTCCSAITSLESLREALYKVTGSLDEAEDFLGRANYILQSRHASGPKFVWNDGVLVDAIVKGAWVVLDDANLCNAAVLDRLNSLLEPNGHLVINEQHGANGGAISIKPHRDFRILLTMDPKYGELSRAMRNRSLEVFLEQRVLGDKVSPFKYPWTSSIYSLRGVFDQSPDLAIGKPFIDNLTLGNVDVLRDQPGYTISQLTYPDAIEPFVCPQVSNAISTRIYGPEKDAAMHNPQFPLLNEPYILRYLGYSEMSLVSLLGTAWDAMAALLMASSNLKNAEIVAVEGRALTRLERVGELSIVRRRDHKDPRARKLLPIWEFLSATVKTAIDFVKTCVQSDSSLEELDGIGRVARYLRELAKLFNAERFDEAHFQALLQIGVDLCKSLYTDSHSFYQPFSDALRHFQARQLQSGQSSQTMWQAWRPETPSDMTQLARNLSLESLIGQFKKISLLLPQTRSALFAVKSKLLEASANRLRGVTAGDIIDLSDSIEDLAASSENRREINNHFQDIFDTILRKEILLRSSGCRRTEPILEAFGDFKILTGLHEGARDAADALQRLSIFCEGIDLESHGLAEQILSEVNSLQHQSLRALDRLVESGSALATVLSSQASLVTSDILHAVRSHCQTLLSTILECHRGILQDHGFEEQGDLNWLVKMTKPPAVDEAFQYFMSIAYDHLKPAATILIETEAELNKQSQLCLIGAVLVHLSLAGLQLVVTDRPFDPALYPQMVRQQYESAKKEIADKIDLQREFNLRLMGQDSSLVQRLYENQLVGFADRPETIVVARPEVSELSKVQDEFTVVIRNILETAPKAVLSMQKNNSMCQDFLQEWPRLRTNVDRVESRLGQLNRAYDDIVVPVRQLLQCYKLGAEFMASSSEDIHPHKLDHLSSHTILLGATPDEVLRWSPVKFSSKPLSLGWLKHFAIQSRMKARSIHNEEKSEHSSYISTVDSLYRCWKKQLAERQMKVEAESRYYTYRGSEQDGAEAADVAEMFPDYDEENVNTQTSNHFSNVQDLSVRLYDIHEEMFKNSMSGREMQQHILETLRSEIYSTEPIDDVLPAILLQLRHENKTLAGGDDNPTTNIYTDASIPEIRKLVTLVQNVQNRFNQISDRFPEHAVPHEVVSFTEEVLDFPINIPLAKMLTKAEKLLEIMSQWHSVASSEWSVASLIEGLTSLIISWRRMELSSWSKLLLLEKQKSDAHVKTWFFIAYEACIYNSRQIVEAGDVTSYCQGLAKTLEDFLRFTTLGQFSPRLKLLGMLSKSLEVLEHEDPRLGPVVSCVQNMVSHFSRYEANIQESLGTGQAELEKAVTEQIKLASWKDTNTMALRESARRSHFKLFKVVKKYRALLEQPITSFQSLELDMGSQLSVPSVELEAPPPPDNTVVRAAQICEKGIPDWNSRPSRLRNPMSAAMSMRHVYSDQNHSVDVARELSKMRTELAASIKELRKETPTTLTDENIAAIKHLRERKKKLLSETLKSVAHMGVRRNLASRDLEKQSSIAVVLAAAPALNHNAIFELADAAFYELLDSMPRIRAALGDHSADLTDGEVRRAVGLLEGLLSIILNQRRQMSASSDALNKFDTNVEFLKSISRFSSDIMIGRPPPSFGALVKYLPWLSVVLDISCDVLHFQQEQGDGLNLSSLKELLQNAATMCREEQTRVENTMNKRPLPEGLFSKLISDWQVDTWAKLECFGNALREWSIKEPNVEYLLKQIIPWVTSPQGIIETGKSAIEGHLGFQDVDEHIRKAADSIFVALQDLSQVKTHAPISTKDAGWLVQSERFLQDLMNSLHIQTVLGSLMDALDRIQYLKGEELQLSLSILTMAAPLFEQYQRICQDLLQKQATSLIETCRLACFFTKTFATVSAGGFCSPVDPSDGQEQSGNVESGTGLGEGEGTEDISKDVGPDEDLGEFGQGGEKPDEGEMGDAEDAIDMGPEDLQGDMDEEWNNRETQDGSSEQDEKMWDEAAKKSGEKEKELKTEKQKGAKGQDQTERQDGEAEIGDEENMDELDANNEEREDDELGEGKAEAENLDSHVKDEKALELPDEMQLDGEENPGEDDLSDDGMDNLSDIEQPAGIAEEVEEIGHTNREEQSDGAEDDQDVEDKDSDAESAVQDDEVTRDHTDEAHDEALNAERTENEAPGYEDYQAGADTGDADGIQTEINPQQEAEGHNEVIQRDNDEKLQGDKAVSEHDIGTSGHGAAERIIGHDDQSQNPQDQALRRLAEVLERWHERREILDSSKDQQDGELDEADMADADFEHVEGEDEGDAQALGAASAEQAQNLDPSKTIQSEDTLIEEDVHMPGMQEEDRLSEAIQLDRMNRLRAALNGESKVDDGNSFVPSRDRNQSTALSGATNEENSDDVDDDPETATHDQFIDEAPTSPQTSSASAAELWFYCSQLVRSFSLVLTEQLRLILSPTTATKLRGDFRTGKRLNIKRIIPYIASGYKRDKIWMRRSVPSKRNYQVLLAVDDSKSMSESGVDLLALQTTALLCTSLSILETGDISVIGFGEAPKVTVAHEFGKPWTNESGVKVFQHLGFNQQGTNVKSMVAQSLEMLREARMKSTASNASELWQLQLIISDGHCSDHEAIRRLVRQAKSEKVVMVFAIVDNSVASTADGRSGESILDLKEAVFEPDVREGREGEMRVVTRRYLESFPFEYYLVVRNLEYEADVGHTNDIGSRMTDTAQFRQDLDLWRLLLEFCQHRNGIKGAKKIWLAMMFRGKPVQLESDNRNASDLMQSIIAASAADDIDFLKAFVKDCIRRGILQEQLFIWVVGTLLLLQPEAAPSLAIILRPSCFQGKADLLEIFHLACQSDNTNALRCFCQVHSLFPGFYIYNDLIPSLWEANRASDALMLHQYLLSKGDLPRTFEVLKPFVQHIASTNGDLEALLRDLRAADISFDAQILRLHSTLLAKPLEKVKEPRKISDEIAARILASFPFEFAVRNLRFFGLIEVGPLFVRQMVKSAASSKALKERFETLKEFKIDLGSSTFVRLVRRLSSNGVFEAVKQVADSDMHHDEYEDHDLQKDLLREYHMTDSYRSITHTLTVISEGDIDPRHQNTSNNLLLRSAIEMGDHLKTLRTVDHLCQQGYLIEEDSLKLLIQNMLHPSAQTNPSVDSVGFLIGLLQRVLGAGNRIPPWMWLRPLAALATQGRLEEFERLLMWLADRYTASSPKRHSVARNLSSLFTPPMQNAIIDWSFKKAAWKQSRGNLNELDLASSSATARSSLPWLRGATILKTLRDEYDIAIDLESLHATFNLCIKQMEPLLELKNYARRHDKVYGRKRHLPEVRQAHRVLFGGAENDENYIEKSFGQLCLNDELPTFSREVEHSKALPKQSSETGQRTWSALRHHKSQDCNRHGGLIHLTPSEQRQLTPLLSHPNVHSHVVSFPAFSSRLLLKFNVRKSGEGSFSECLLLEHKENPSDVAVLKIIPFNLSGSRSSSTSHNLDDGSTITDSTVSAVLREIKILSALSAYHGFTAVRSCHVVRGPWHEGFLEAYHAFHKNHPDLALNPLPSERWDDKMIYGVIEMDNAGMDLEKLAKPSAFQVYDAFWMTTVLLAVVERELEFEHRDLHMSNILYREHIPGKGLDISHAVVRGMKDHEPDVLLGLTNLKITIIDYTMSRLRVKADNDYNDDDENGQDNHVLFSPDSAWSTASCERERDTDLDSLKHNLDVDDHQTRTGLRIHRLVSLHHQANTSPKPHTHNPHDDNSSNKWHAHLPATTTLWLAHTLHQLLKQAGSRPRHVPGSSTEAKKLQTRIWKQLREVLETIDRDDPAALNGGGAVELLNTGMEKGWIRERDVQVFKDKLNDELL